MNPTGPRRQPEKPQQVTRIPPYWPGTWVKIQDIRPGDPGHDLSGKVRRVKSLTCSITSPDQKTALWRVHFDDGRNIICSRIERAATDHEIRAARTRPT